jgi:hypothetical protein
MEGVVITFTASWMVVTMEEYAKVIILEVKRESLPEYLCRNITSKHLFEKCTTIAIMIKK